MNKEITPKNCFIRVHSTNKTKHFVLAMSDTMLISLSFLFNLKIEQKKKKSIETERFP